MLMICWLVCGPSAKRENGSETEMPGCKIKFELSRKKKSSRKTTSTSESTINHPKLYSFVRLSFICTQGWLSISVIASRFTFGGNLAGRLLETDDAAERFRVREHVHNFNARAFHVVQHRVHARR